MNQENKNGKLLLLVIMAIALSGLIFLGVWKNGSRRSIGGLKEPVQTKAEGQDHIYVGDVELSIEYLYDYEIDALVLHTKNYTGGDIWNKVSPRDIALGWGDVALYNKVIDFHWSQSGRWLHWRVGSYDELSPVGGPADVTRQCSNNHLIAADYSTKSTIAKMRRGDHVRLKGYLVDIKGVDSKGGTYSWSSSTSRTDEGVHACELIYVTGAEILD